MLEIFLLLLGVLTVLVFGVMAVLTIKDYYEENKKQG